MTLCVIDGKACRCQPDEGQFCEIACARLVELEKALKAATDDMRAHGILRVTHPAAVALGLTS